MSKDKKINTKTTNSSFGLLWEEEKDELMQWGDLSTIELQEVKTKSIIADKKKPTHYLIEGDNLPSLHALQKEFTTKIDLIYIDPPYNTGFKQDQEGFQYHDKRREAHHVYSHSTWLNFMKLRLEAAYILMADSGLMFISIDQHEFAHLKLLCDQIFGEENFINYLVWKKRSTGGQVKDGSIITQTEFIFIYAKNKAKATLHKIENDAAGTIKWRDFRKSGGQWQQRYRPKQHYPFYYDEKKNILSLKRLTPSEIEIFPMDAKGELGFWENGLDTATVRLKNDELKVTKSKNGQYKIAQLEVATETKNAGNFIDIPSVQGSHEIKEFDLHFNNVKPLALLSYIIEMGSKQDAIVLDFFAGSGSTAHAVMKLNKEKNHHRKCILCTNNEYKLCEEVTYPRLARAIKGYTNKNNKIMIPLSENLKFFVQMQSV